MNVTVRAIFSKTAKTALAAAALGAFLFLAGAPGAKANDWDDGHRPCAVYHWRAHRAFERQEAAERAAYYRHEWREHHRDRDNGFRR